MPTDVSIYGGLLAQPKSALDYASQYGQQQANQLALAAQRQQFGQTQQTIADTNALRAALANGGVDLSTDEGVRKAMSIAPTVAPALAKTFQDSATARALAAKDTAAAQKDTQSTKDAAFAHYQNVLGTVQTPEQAVSMVTATYHDPIVGPMLQQMGPLEQGLAHLQQMSATPEGFQQWKAQAAIGIQKLAELAKVNTVNSGGQTTTQLVQPATGQVTPVASVQNTVAPDAVLAAQTSRANNAAMIGAENARASNALEVEKAKVDPFGTLGINKNAAPGAAAGAGLSGDAYLATLPAGVASQVKAISEGKLQISPMSMRSPQGAALVQMAMQYEPGTDQTTYASRAATAKDAASGKLATSNNALNTLAGHLHDLSQAAAGLDNTRFPWVNSVKNFASDAVGNPAVRDFNLNLQGVADEFERAYRGAGGSEGSIAQWRANLGDASSPEQFKAALAKGAEMLQSKLEANQAQYEQGMSGKPGAYRSITPKAEAALAALRGGASAPGAPPAAAPPGFTITHVDGKPQ